MPSDARAWLVGEVLYHGFTDVLCFGPVQLRPGADSFSLSVPGDIDRGFARQSFPNYSLFAPKLSLRASEQLIGRLLHHRLDRSFVHRLAIGPEVP